MKAGGGHRGPLGPLGQEPRGLRRQRGAGRRPGAAL